MCFRQIIDTLNYGYIGTFKIVPKIIVQEIVLFDQLYIYHLMKLLADVTAFLQHKLLYISHHTNVTSPSFSSRGRHLNAQDFTVFN